MNRFYLIVAFITLLAAPALAAPSFFDDLPDVPVADALTPLPDQGLVFGKPQGRIVEVVSLSQANDSVRSFYVENLPSFGWISVSGDVYKRGDEILKFWFEDHEDQQFFYLRVEPANR